MSKTPAKRYKNAPQLVKKYFAAPFTIQTIFRGCTVRNTKWVYCIAMFTGMETKLMKNAVTKKFKVCCTYAGVVTPGWQGCT